jgi:hypothetical protein
MLSHAEWRGRLADWWASAAKVFDGLDDFLAVGESGDADLLQVVGGQFWQHLGVDRVRIEG